MGANAGARRSGADFKYSTSIAYMNHVTINQFNPQTTSSANHMSSDLFLSLFFFWGGGGGQGGYGPE